MVSDVVVVGGGPSGMFFAYEMLKRHPGKKVTIIERGKKVTDRDCPEERLGRCIKCRLCHHINGSSGSGAFNDGKLSLFNDEDKTFYVGGRLHEFCGVEQTKDLIRYTDEVYLNFGATREVKGGQTPYAREFGSKAKEVGLDLVAIPIRHLGTDWSRKLFTRFEKYLAENGVNTFFNTEVKELIIRDNQICGVRFLSNGEVHEIYANTVVLAVGRPGADWLENLCVDKHIKTSCAPVDIGIRYELPDHVMEGVNTAMYEAKLIGYPEPYKDKVRTFCQNPSGFVAAEGYSGGYTTVNGHSAKETKSSNTNLALLVTLDIPEAKNPIDLCRNICKNVNDISKGQVAIQRLGDLIAGRVTTKQDLAKNIVEPTLKSAVPSDIGVGMPYRIIQDLIAFIKQTDKIIPGFADKNNLIYGPEVKFYSNRIDVDKNFQTSVEGLYAIGDGCGITRGLMMASANGVALARRLTF